MALAQEGDVLAKETLVRKYLPMVRYIVRRTVFSPEAEVEDLVQEGLIGLLGAIRGYRLREPAVKFSSFAYLCIVRKIKNALRRANGAKRKHAIPPVSLHNLLSPENTRMFLDLCRDLQFPGPEELLEQEIGREELKRVLSMHLSVLEYSVVALLVEGYSSREIHCLLGIDGKVVDNARTRVRTKLRRLLNQYGSLLCVIE